MRPCFELACELRIERYREREQSAEEIQEEGVVEGVGKEKRGGECAASPPVVKNGGSARPRVFRRASMTLCFPINPRQRFIHLIDSVFREHLT